MIVIVLLGYFGYGNYGDELLADLLRRELPNKEIIKISKKKSLVKHLQSLWQAQKVIALGGLFQDKTSLWSMVYYCSYLFAAKIFGAQVILKSVGVGPLDKKISRFLFNLLCYCADEISVRDEFSYSFVLQKFSREIIGKDLAWALLDASIDIDPAKLEKRIDLSCLQQGIDILVLRKCDQSFNWQLRFKKLSSQVLLVSFQESDNQFIESICNKYLQDRQVVFLQAEFFSPEELIYIFKNYGKKITSMRYHALILAAIAGLELQVIPCDVKLGNVIQQAKTHSRHPGVQRKDPETFSP